MPREGSVMNQQTEEMRLYFNRVRPMCRELFAMAFTICADYDGAEYALQRTVLTGWQGGRRRRSKRSFREYLRNEARKAALSRAKGGADSDWDLFGADPLGNEDSDPMLRIFRNEPADTRRALMLRYGCGLTSGQISRATGMPSAHADRLIANFMKTLKRRLNADQRGRLDSLMKELCARLLAEEGVEMPDLGAIYRNFEAEAAANYHPVGRAASRTLVFVVAVILMLVLGGIMWCVSAIIRPAQIQDSGLLTEELQEMELQDE